jgi:hypothetical protein
MSYRMYLSHTEMLVFTDCNLRFCVNVVLQDYADELWTNLWLSLETETQPSVRHVLEWVAMWLMFRYQHFRQQLWLLFRKVTITSAPLQKGNY